jgi:acylphosphatase
MPTEAAKRPMVSETGEIRLTAWLRGRVQGVGMRWWVRSRALELGLSGWARNLEDGRVEVVAEGPKSDCAALLDTLRAGGSPGRTESVVERWSDARGLADPAGAKFAER